MVRTESLKNAEIKSFNLKGGDVMTAPTRRVARFSVEKMRIFSTTDRYVAFMVNDLRTRNPQATEREILEWVYNSTVKEDKHLKKAYLLI